MIVSKQRFNWRKVDGKYKQGTIVLSKNIGDYLGWKKQEIVVIVLKKGEKLTQKALAENLMKFNRIIDMENDIKKLKEEII